jgi:hypothetical protein
VIFGFPMAFYFAFVALPVIGFFFFRRRSRLVEIPAIEIWSDLGRPVETRSFRSLLRRLLTLLGQLLLLAGLIMALADPLPHGRVAQRTVFVLDVSYTMQTKEGDQTRLDLAKQKVAALLQTVAPGSEVALIQAAHCPALVLPLTADLLTAREKLDGTAVLDVEGDLLGAAQLAGAFVSQDQPTRVIILSDFAAAEPKALRDAWRYSADLRLLAVGREQPNAAITNLWSDGDGTKQLVHATVRSKGLTGRTIPISLLVNGQSTASLDVILGAGPANVTFPLEAPEGTVFEVTLQTADALSVDDRAWGVVGATSRTGVCLVTADNVPLTQAVQAGDAATVRIVLPNDFHGATAGEVVILDGPLPAPCETGSAAGYLVIGSADPFGWTTPQGWRPATRITQWSAEHPCLIDLDPTVFHLERILELNWGGQAEVKRLIGANDVTLVAERLAPDQVAANHRPVRCVYWLFDVRRSDLSRRLGFPILLWNTIDYLSQRHSSELEAAHLTGRPLVLAPSPSGELPVVVGPGGDHLTVRSGGESVIVSDTTRQGLYQRLGSSPARYAVNLFSTQGVRPLPTEAQLAAASPDTEIAGPVAGWWHRYTQLSWESLLLAALLLALLEWLLFNRGIIRLG